MKSLGRQLVVEFYDCSPEILNDIRQVEYHMKEAAIVAGSTIVQSVFHFFNPQGVSGTVVIAESHLAIHTWPEYGYAAIDIFTCGEEVNPWAAYRYLKEALQSQYDTVKAMERGLFDFEVKVKPDAPIISEKLETGRQVI